MKVFLVVFLSVVFVSHAYAEERIEVDPIELSNLEDIEDAEMLSANLDTAVQHVMACMDEGKDNIVCQCENIDLLRAFQEKLRSTLDKHPEWAGQDIFYKQRDEEGIMRAGVSTSFTGLENQSKMIDELKCNGEAPLE